MFTQSTFSEALHQVKKQQFKEQFWFWGPWTIWNNLVSGQFFLSQISYLVGIIETNQKRKKFKSKRCPFLNTSIHTTQYLKVLSLFTRSTDWTWKHFSGMHHLPVHSPQNLHCKKKSVKIENSMGWSESHISMIFNFHILYDLHSIPSTTIHWIYNFRKFVSISAGKPDIGPRFLLLHFSLREYGQNWELNYCYPLSLPEFMSLEQIKNVSFL